jgi:acetyl/propionyl-CoA carboxylase alpha subunit
MVERPDSTHVVAFAVMDGANTWVFLDGVTYVLEPTRRGRAAAAHDTAALSAPMPATVTHIHVAPDQAVASGDLLVTLEAMKMELPIRAPGPGIVVAINCTVGELVQPGEPLVDLREPDSGTEHEPGTRKPEA